MDRSLQHWFADWAALGWFCHPQKNAQRSTRSVQAASRASSPPDRSTHRDGPAHERARGIDP
jgi:hypothetical protein